MGCTDPLKKVGRSTPASHLTYADVRLHIAMTSNNNRPYAPMKKPGGLVLGLGGDTSPGGVGTFYEGVVTRGYTTDAADDAVQANIVAARYGV